MEWIIFNGSVVHSTENEQMLVADSQLLGVLNGKIMFLEDETKINKLIQQFGFNKEIIHKMAPHEFLMPGFVDTHIHGPQYPNIGLGVGLPLLDWLNEFTYPLERKFQKLEVAKNVYRQVVSRTLACGTTTALYFATQHLEATLALCDALESQGQRGYVGKVNMDCAPELEDREETENSVNLSRQFLEEIRKREYTLVSPAITPRFALSCTEDLMCQLGDLAKEHDALIQTHISESRSEVDEVKNTFPNCKNYADVYDKCNLLTEKTVLAHGIYLDDSELDTILARKCGISHCPNSNISLKSGLCDVRRLLDRGLKIGLGTDVSGGYSVSILDAMRQAINVSHIIGMSRNEKFETLSYKEAFRLATLYGSKVLALDDKIGNFEIGKEFDALLIDINATYDSPFSETPSTTEENVQRFIFTGDDKNILRVYVRGRQVKGDIK